VSVSGGGGSFGGGVCSLACIMAQLHALRLHRMRKQYACRNQWRRFAAERFAPWKPASRGQLVSAVAAAASRTSHKLLFSAGQQWSGSSWDIALRVQELTTALATFNRVDQQAMPVSVTCAADGTICLSLGCSAALAAQPQSHRHILM